MKIAVIGSRSITSICLDNRIPENAEIISGGAVGVDSCAAEYARAKGLKFTVFYPQYSLYKRAAPIVRNKQIVDYADKILVFWDGKSRGTLSVIEYAKKTHKECEIIVYE